MTPDFENMPRWELIAKCRAAWRREYWSIHDAPKDGSKFVAVYEDESGFFVCRWNKEDGGYWENIDSGGEEVFLYWCPFLPLPEDAHKCIAERAMILKKERPKVEDIRKHLADGGEA